MYLFKALIDKNMLYLR